MHKEGRGEGIVHGDFGSAGRCVRRFATAAQEADRDGGHLDCEWHYGEIALELDIGYERLTGKMCQRIMRTADGPRIERTNQLNSLNPLTNG